MKNLKTIFLFFFLSIFLSFCVYLPPTFAAGATASGKTVANLTREVRYLLNETESSTTGFFKDGEIEAWINDAVRNVIARGHPLSSVTHFTLSSGTSEYSITDNYVAVRAVLYQSGITAFKGLQRGSKAAVGNIGDAYEEPRHFYETKSRTGVGIYPLIDSDDNTVSGNTIYVSYTPMQTTLSGASPIPTPASFDRHIVYYAVGQGFIKDNKMKRAQFVLSQYQAELDRFRVDLYDWEQSIWDFIWPGQGRRTQQR